MNHKTESDTARWPDSNRYPKSIRFHFSLYVAVIILVLMAITSIIVSEKHSSVVARGIVDRLLVQARSYGSSASKHFLTKDDPDALMLNSICRKFSDESKDIYWVAIADSKGVLVAHSNVRKIASIGQLPTWTSNKGPNSFRLGETHSFADDTIRINVPILEGQLVVGQIELAASVAPIKLARMQSLITMASVTLLVLVIGLPLTIFLTHRMLRPISVITEHLRNTKVGDLKIDIPITTRNEFGYLADTLRIMAHKVKEAQLQTVERERMAKELEIAREIQTNILPKTFPRKNQYESYGFYQSAKEVGGDYFDFVELDSHRLGILVADVSGKSLPGVLVMLLTRDIVRQTMRFESDPAQIVKHVNKELLSNIKKGMFVTMFLGVLDCSNGRFEFVSAGHNPLLLKSSLNNSIKQIRPKGFPLGLMPSAQFDERIEMHSLDLQPEDILIQYSDGINEAQNSDGEEYGMDRFISSLRQYEHDSAEILVHTAMNSHEAFVGSASQYDDITLVALKWHGIMTDKSNGERNGDNFRHQHQRA